MFTHVVSGHVGWRGSNVWKCLNGDVSAGRLCSDMIQLGASRYDGSSLASAALIVSLSRSDGTEMPVTTF